MTVPTHYIEAEKFFGAASEELGENTVEALRRWLRRMPFDSVVTVTKRNSIVVTPGPLLPPAVADDAPFGGCL